MKDLLLIATVVTVLVIGVGTAPALQAQEAGEAEEDFSVLVYSRTAGFRHLSIPEGIAAIQDLGAEHGFGVEATEDPAAFTDDNLARFAAVVFLNTTGTVVEDEGKAAFERYVRGGGAWVGVHSAADTEYDWPFYEELLAGAYFLSHPVQQPGVLQNEAPDHPSTAHLPERWQIPFEEFYSFQQSPRPHVRVLLNIDESTYSQDPNTSHLPDEETFPSFPEGETGVMGEDHPMSWCHEIDDGHAWYTALGHEGYLYRTPDFRAHLLGGILTATGRLEADCAPRAAQAPGEQPTEEPEPEATGEPEDGGPAPTAPSPAEDSRPPLPATGAGLLLPALILLALGLALRRVTRGEPRP
jgi:uncharacterized protein